jgi:hypothetical protein
MVRAAEGKMRSPSPFSAMKTRRIAGVALAREGMRIVGGQIEFEGK